MEKLNQLELETLLIEANNAYRLGEPIISDLKWDNAMEILKNKFPESNLLNKSILSEKLERKVKLPYKMTSLDKLKSVEEVKQWMSNYPSGSRFVLMAKLDGISLLTHGYKCWTRGDGEFGQCSDDHFEEMKPKLIMSYMCVGEAIMKNKVFNESYLTQGFSNTRNTVAGLFNSKNPNIFLSDIDYIRYGICNSELSKSNQLSLLQSEGFDTVNHNSLIFVENFDIQLLNYYKELWSKVYKIDGLVIEVDSNEFKAEFENNGNPKFAKAIKLPEWSTSAISKVVDVLFKVSKQGKLKPVIQIEPTDIDGVIVSNVTGYNMSYMVDNFIAKDSEIKIVRSGDVIPKHIETLSRIILNVEKLIDDTMTCPVCGEPTVWDDNFTEIVCTNAKCQGVAISKIEHFFSTLEFENFSNKGIEQLYKEGIVCISDYFFLEVQDLTSIDGWADSSAQNLLSQLKTLKTKGVSLSKLLHSLDIFEGKIGEKDCQLIIDNLITENIKDWKNIPLNSLTSIAGIGDIKAQAFVCGINKYFSELFDTLPIKFSFIKSPKIEQSGNSFENINVCVTGFRDASIDDFIKNNGGKICSGVSKKTNLLIVEDMNTNSTKAQKARELGCKIISRFEVEQMMD